MKTALLLTANRRPYYFQPTLQSWANARGFASLDRVAIALGYSDRTAQMWKIINNFHRPLQVIPDRIRGSGLHRAIGEGIDYLFRKGGMDYVIYSEEDVIVSDDALEYFFWAGDKFRDDSRILAVLAHSVGGQGWDLHEPAQDTDADQQQVRLQPYFNAWGLATWKDRWEKILHPQWDFTCASGGPTDSGWDWHIATRIIPQGNYLCVVPDASRSQNTGRAEGWASSEWSFSFSQAQSFREHRDPGNYQLVEGE